MEYFSQQYTEANKEPTQDGRGEILTIMLRSYMCNIPLLSYSLLLTGSLKTVQKDQNIKLSGSKLFSTHSLALSKKLVHQWRNENSQQQKTKGS